MSALTPASLYPTAHDMLHRRHVIRRDDALYCLAIVAWHRTEGRYAEARAVLKTARRYADESRALGFRLPG